MCPQLCAVPFENIFFGRESRPLSGRGIGPFAFFERKSGPVSGREIGPRASLRTQKPSATGASTHRRGSFYVSQKPRGRILGPPVPVRRGF